MRIIKQYFLNKKLKKIESINNLQRIIKTLEQLGASGNNTAKDLAAVIKGEK